MKWVYSECAAQNKTLGRVSDTVDPLLGNCSQPHPKVGQGKTVNSLKKVGILRTWLTELAHRNLAEQQPVTWNDKWVVWGIWLRSHLSLWLSGICIALLGSWEIQSLLRERLASGARVSDSWHQSPWDRWRCPGKLSLGSRLCYLFFTITVSTSCLYLFEMIHNKQKQRGLFSSFAPASSPRPSRLSRARPPRIPPTTSQEAVLATNFSKEACFP